MAVKLIANYAKRLGLPGYSSHQFSVSVEIELGNVEDVQAESERLYKELQEAVDGQIQQTGFVPPHEYGMNGKPQNGNGTNGHGTNGNGHHQNGNGYSARPQNGSPPVRNADDWNCTVGQRELILRLVNEGKLEKTAVEQMSQEMFQVGVKRLDRMQASQLIEELLEKSGKKTNGRSRWQRR